MEKGAGCHGEPPPCRRRARLACGEGVKKAVSSPGGHDAGAWVFQNREPSPATIQNGWRAARPSLLSVGRPRRYGLMLTLAGAVRREQRARDLEQEVRAARELVAARRARPLDAVPVVDEVVHRRGLDRAPNDAAVFRVGEEREKARRRVDTTIRTTPHRMISRAAATLRSPAPRARLERRGVQLVGVAEQRHDIRVGEHVDERELTRVLQRREQVLVSIRAKRSRARASAVSRRAHRRDSCERVGFDTRWAVCSDRWLHISILLDEGGRDAAQTMLYPRCGFHSARRKNEVSPRSICRCAPSLLKTSSASVSSASVSSGARAVSGSSGRPV